MAQITDSERTAMERNLRLLPWWWIFRWVWLGEAFWVIYLIRVRGLTIGDVIYFEAVLAGVALASEIPTGIVADRFGRRVAMLLGTLVAAVAFLMFGLGETIPLLVGSYALFGVADAFISGTDNAFLFDTLQRLGRGDEFARRAGRLNAMQTGAIAAFTVVGGVMIRWTPMAWPLVLSGILSFGAVLLVLVLKDPPHEGDRLSFLGTGSSAIRRVRRTPSMWTVTLLTALASLPIFIMAITIQPIVVSYGVPLWTLGLFAGAQMALSAVGGLSASPIKNRLGLRRTFQTMAILAAVSLFGGASGLIWLFPLFILPSITWNVMHPHLADFLSRRSPERERATTLSLANVSERGLTIPATLLLAFSVDQWGLQSALAGAGAILLVLVLIAYVGWTRTGDTEVEPAE